MDWYVNGGAMKLAPEESRCTSETQSRLHEVVTCTKLSALLSSFSQSSHKLLHFTYTHHYHSVTANELTLAKLA